MPPDENSLIWKEVDRLRKEVERLKNISTPTMPIYDHTNFPQDGVEGQHVSATDETAWHFVNNQWHQIGGVSFTPWALLSMGVFLSVPSGVDTYYDFDPATNSYFNTSDSSIFTTSAYTSGSLAGIHGLQIIQPGLYYVEFATHLAGNTVAGTNVVVSSQSQLGGSAAASLFNFGDQAPSRISTGSDQWDPCWTQIIKVSSDLTTHPITCMSRQNSGVTMTSVNASIFTTRIDTEYPAGLYF